MVLDALSFSAPADVLSQLLKLGALPSQGTDAKGRAPLLLAVDQRNHFAISSLLAHKANATVLDAAGRSALSAAMAMTAWKTAEALLKAGADPQKGVDKDGHKPLLAATIAGMTSLTQDSVSEKEARVVRTQDTTCPCQVFFVKVTSSATLCNIVPMNVFDDV